MSVNMYRLHVGGSFPLNIKDFSAFKSIIHQPILMLYVMEYIDSYRTEISLTSCFCWLLSGCVLLQIWKRLQASFVCTGKWKSWIKVQIVVLEYCSTGAIYEYINKQRFVTFGLVNFKDLCLSFDYLTCRGVKWEEPHQLSCIN